MFRTSKKSLAYADSLWNAQEGLLSVGSQVNMIFFDCISTSGYIAYNNAWFYRALLMAADLEESLGRSAQAQQYQARADQIKQAFVPQVLDSIPRATPERRAYLRRLCRLDRGPGRSAGHDPCESDARQPVPPHRLRAGRRPGGPAAHLGTGRWSPQRAIGRRSQMAATHGSLRMGYRGVQELPPRKLHERQHFPPVDRLRDPGASGGGAGGGGLPAGSSGHEEV